VIYWQHKKHAIILINRINIHNAAVIFWLFKKEHHLISHKIKWYFLSHLKVRVACYGHDHLDLDHDHLALDHRPANRDPLALNRRPVKRRHLL